MDGTTFGWIIVGILFIGGCIIVYLGWKNKEN